MTVNGKMLVPAEVSVHPADGPRLAIFIESDADGCTNGSTLPRSSAGVLAHIMMASVDLWGMSVDVGVGEFRYVRRPETKGARFEYVGDSLGQGALSVRLSKSAVRDLAKELDAASFACKEEGVEE